jgi:hypothetical protein
VHAEQRSGHGEAAFPAMIDPDKQDVALRNKSGEPIVFRLQLSRSRYYSQLQL